MRQSLKFLTKQKIIYSFLIRLICFFHFSFLWVSINSFQQFNGRQTEVFLLAIFDNRNKPMINNKYQSTGNGINCTPQEKTPITFNISSCKIILVSNHILVQTCVHVQINRLFFSKGLGHLSKQIIKHQKKMWSNCIILLPSHLHLADLVLLFWKGKKRGNVCNGFYWIVSEKLYK